MQLCVQIVTERGCCLREHLKTVPSEAITNTKVCFPNHVQHFMEFADAASHRTHSAGQHVVVNCIRTFTSNVHMTASLEQST